MGYQDRRYKDKNYGDEGAARFIRATNSFFNWSFPLLTVPEAVPGIGGIHVRVHILYILIVIGQAIKAVAEDGIGLGALGMRMSTLFVLVLLHEFGHCVACRRVGGRADEVLMWPLGGLAFCAPPQRWTACLVTTLGGPGVNVILLPMLGGALMGLGAQWSDVVFNPLSPTWSDAIRESAGLRWLWSAYYMNLSLLLFNMLLPMYPMDCGRVVQELLWWRLGYKRSMQISVNLGLLVAVLLCLFGIVTWNMMLVSIALFGGMTCLNERRRIDLIEDQPAWAFDTDKGYKGFENTLDKNEEKAAKALIKKQRKEREEAARTEKEVDRILEKIKKSGIQSISERERQILQDASERRQ